MRKFLQRWRDQWTVVDTIMASLAAATFVSSLEVTVLRLWLGS